MEYKNDIVNEMKPIPFDVMLKEILQESSEKGTVYGVPIMRERINRPIGVAAGPHTQLAGNIVAAYVAGALDIELKTVQVLEGEELGIQKPCIYAGNEVFNTEWSTELTIPEALEEYIKAYLLIQVIGRELQFEDMDKVKFICSVGYDLVGIKSKKVDDFLNNIQKATETSEWKEDIEYLYNNLGLFTHLSKKDIDIIKDNYCISDTVTLSTMHGCKAEDIGKIAEYLLVDKQLNTYVKLNPTLIGIEDTRRIWGEKGYDNITCREETFDNDITLEAAVEMINHCLKTASDNHKIFGVKFTNTFPVISSSNELGEDEETTMYLSGKALYPIAIKAASLVLNKIGENLPVSYSGGADEHNIVDLLETGMQPITLCSVLLQPGGYKNITKVVKAAKNAIIPEYIDVKGLENIAKKAREDKLYDYKADRTFERKEPYDEYCAKCNNCVDICPNRANIRIEDKDGAKVVHKANLCNECGCCTQFCIMGHKPYVEKKTIMED